MEITPGKVEVLLVVHRFVWTGAKKSDISKKRSISRKVTWEGEIFQLNRTG